MEKITMADIAQLAGVTKSTVSRYFNGGYVRQETREKIQEVIKKYNYTPNTFAPSLTVNRRKNRRIPCIYWAAAIFSLLRTIVIYSFPLLFFWIVLILLLVMNW